MAGIDVQRDIVTREAGWNDIDDIVQIHQQAFVDFFLTRLGARFLRLYYSTVLEARGGILLIAEGQKKQSLGFVAGFTDTAVFYRLLKRKRWSIARAVILPVLRSPKLARRLLSSASMAGERIESGENSMIAELSSIAIADSGKRADIGRLLLDYFCDEATQRGMRIVVLRTDAASNESVNAFYTKVGFRVTSEFVTSEGRKMNEYQYELKNRQRALQ